MGTVESGLEREITGTINRTGKPGIAPLRPAVVHGTVTNRTLVRFESSSGYKTSGKFIFYGDLPLSVQGWMFAFREKRNPRSKIPIEQYLHAYTMSGEYAEFYYPLK